MSLRVLSFLSLRQMRMKWLQSVLAILGIAGGIALHTAVGSINQSILDYFRQSLNSVAGESSLFITAGPTGFDEKEITAVVEKTLGVAKAVPVVEARVFIYKDNSFSESMLIMGVDLLKEQNVRSYKTVGQDDSEIIDDPVEFFNQADSLILPQSFAEQHGLTIGSILKVSTTTGSKEFTLRGLIAASDFAAAFGGAIGIMDILGAQHSFGKVDKLDRLDIVLAAGFTTEQVQKSLIENLGPGFTVERPQGRTERIERLFEAYQFMLSFFGSLALIVGVVLVYSMVSRSVAERRQEIGTYRALGASRSLILFGFVVLGMIQGVLGGALGSVLSIFVSNALIESVAQSMTSQFDMLVAIDRIKMQPMDLLMAVGKGALVAMVAAAWPAWRATQVTPVEAMRKDPNPSSSPSKSAHRKTGIIFFVGLLSCVVSALILRDERIPLAANLLAQLMLVVGALLAVSSLSVLAVVLLSRKMGWGRGRLLRIGVENILRSPGQAAQNSAVMTVGLLILCIFQGTGSSFRYSLQSWADREVYWDLGVVSAGDFMSFRTQPLDASIGSELLKIPGVMASPQGILPAVRMTKMQIDGREVLIEAYDDPGLDEARAILLQSEDAEIGMKIRQMFESSELTVLASEGFLRQSAKKVGDLVQIPSADGMKEARITAKINDFSFAGGSLYMDRKKYSQIWKDPLVTVFGVKVDPKFELDSVRREIDQRLAQKRNLMVISASESRKQLSQELNKSLRFMDALMMAVMAVVLMSLINTYLIAVMERRREIGMLRAVGVSKPQLITILLGEYLVHGLLTSVFTLVVGGAITFVLVRSSISDILGWSLKFHFPVSSMILLIGVGVGVTLLAALIPIFLATRMQITEALRHD